MTTLDRRLKTSYTKQAEIGSVWIRNYSLMRLVEKDEVYYTFDIIHHKKSGVTQTRIFKEDFNRSFYMKETDPLEWYLAVMKDYWEYVV